MSNHGSRRYVIGDAQWQAVLAAIHTLSPHTVSPNKRLRKPRREQRRKAKPKSRTHTQKNKRR